MTMTPGDPATPVDVRDVRAVLRGALLGLGAAALISIPFLVLLVLVRTEAAGLAGVDHHVADGLHDLVSDLPHLVDLLLLISAVSAPWVLRGIAFVVAIVLWRSGDRLGAVWLAVTMVVGGVLGLVLKELVERARPEFAEPVMVATGYSFPSGHALNSMLFAACMMVLVNPRTHGAVRAVAWALAVLFVVVVGLDRIALGVHYVSDVLAGWIVALATVTGTTLAFGITKSHRFVTSSSGNP